MYCRVPYVDFPTCKTPYSATNWWFDVYTAIMMTWNLFLCWDLWRATLKLTRHGFPQTVDGLQFLLAPSYFTLKCLYFVNPMSLRLGGLFTVLGACADYLSDCIAGIFAISILASVRSAAKLQEGTRELPAWERRAYVAGAVSMCAICIPAMVVVTLGQLYNTVPRDTLRIALLIKNWGLIVLGGVHLILTLLFIRTFRHDPRSAMLLKTVKVTASVYLIVLFFVAFVVYTFYTANPWEGTVGNLQGTVDSLGSWIASIQIAFIAIFFLSTWMLPRMRNRLGLQWGETKGNEDARRVEMGEAVLPAIAVTYFSLGVYVPAVMPAHSIAVFLFAVMLVLCFSTTVWIGKSSRVPREYLYDLCAASYLQKHNSWVNLVKFRIRSMKDTVFDFVIFSTMPFSSATPWPYWLKPLDFMGTLENLKLSDKQWHVVLTAVVIVYFGWLMASFCLRAFPTSSSVHRTHCIISWFLYLPVGLSATCVLLRGTQCLDDGTLAWNGTPCDGSSAHRAIVIFGISGAIWFVCLPSLHFAGVGKFNLRLLAVENPVVSVHNHLLRALAVFSALYLRNTWRIIADIVIVFLATAQQFYDPLIIGHARLNSCRAGAFSAALSCHILAPLNFLLLDSFIPIALCLVCIPAMFVLGFKGTYNRFAVIAAEIKTLADSAKNLDFATPNLPPRLLGVCLHASPLNQFLRAHLNVVPKKAKSQSAVVPENQLVHDRTLVSLALTHLAAAISMRCGKLALQRSPEYVRTMPQWLDSPHRSAAIECVLAMADIEALHVDLHTHVMPALLSAWQQVYGGCHTSCAESIIKIRGMDKIMVSFGLIQQIRCIAIPYRTVWVVPSAPTLVKDDPIDALLTFPPNWNLPLGDIMPTRVPHFCVPTTRDIKSSNAEDPTRISQIVESLAGSTRNLMDSARQFPTSRRAIESRVSGRQRLSASLGLSMLKKSCNANDPVALSRGTVGPLVGSTQHIIHSQRQFETTSRCSIASRMSGAQRLSPSDDSSMLQDATVVPVARDNEEGAPSTWRQSRLHAMSSAPVSGGDAPSAVAKDDKTAMSPPVSEGGESSHSRVRQGSENNHAWVPWEDADGVASSVAKKEENRRESMDSREDGDGVAFSIAKKEENTGAMESREGGDVVASSREGDGVCVTPVTQHSGQALPTAPSTDSGALKAPTLLEVSSSMIVKDGTATCQSGAGSVALRGLSERRALKVEKTPLWGSSQRMHRAAHRARHTRRAHVLFRLHEYREQVPEDEDGVPTALLRKALTAFYAFKLLPRDVIDEEDVDDNSESEK